MIAGVGGVGVGIFANPWLTTGQAIVRALVYVTTAGAACWLLVELRRAWRFAPVPPVDSRTPARPYSGRAWIVFVAIVFCWLVLYRERFLRPAPPIGDDAHYLRDSADWPTTLGNLFAPYNEHMVVPARLLTYAVISIAGWIETPVHQPMAAATSGLFLTTLVLLFAFARRWWGNDAAGLFTVVLFAMSTSYREVILWYSASQWLFSFGLLLAGLLLVTISAERPRRRSVAAGMLVAFCGPFAYSIGVLVGPLCTIYGAARQCGAVARRSWTVLAPSVGTVAALPVATALRLSWFGTPGYSESGGRGPEAFRAGDGLVYILRLGVDLLVLRNLGYPHVTTEQSLIWVVPLEAVAVVGLLRLRPALWRLWPHAVLIGLPYACTIPFRTWVEYGVLTNWSRYQLFPQLGLALLLTGAVRELAPAWLSQSEPLTSRQASALVLLTVILLSLQEGLAR
jgi:hypothetical protein